MGKWNVTQHIKGNIERTVEAESREHAIAVADETPADIDQLLRSITNEGCAVEVEQTDDDAPLRPDPTAVDTTFVSPYQKGLDERIFQPASRLSRYQILNLLSGYANYVRNARLQLIKALNHSIDGTPRQFPREDTVTTQKKTVQFIGRVFDEIDTKATDKVNNLLGTPPEFNDLDVK